MITQIALGNKNLTPLLLIILGMCCDLTASVHAQPIHIPDKNLLAAIRETLGHDRISTSTVRRLRQLDAGNRRITDLTGLQHATHLTHLYLNGNQLISLTPIVTLKRLTNLNIANCSISDITPLSSLTNLISLECSTNNITDIRPIAKLYKLVELRTADNFITDITPLTNLPNLNYVDIRRNPIFDYQPLNLIALDHLAYDEECNIAPLPLLPRLENRNFPSVFGPSWLLNLEAEHDLHHSGPLYELPFRKTKNGWEMRGNVEYVKHIHQQAMAANPNKLFFVIITMRNTCSKCRRPCYRKQAIPIPFCNQ